MKIVFFGTPWFAAHILEYLIDNRVVPCAVVTKEDKPVGRSSRCVPPPVKQVAGEKAPAVPLFQPAKVSTEEMEKIFTRYEPDLFVVVAYGEILKQNILNIPKKGCINVHASLLPLLRGASPIQQAIVEGHKKTGVTIMEMVLKMDAGDIIKKAELEITEEMTAGELEKALCERARPLLLEVIQDFEKGSVHKVPQDHEKATYVRKIQPEDCRVIWTRPAQVLHNLIRGLQPKPGAFCDVIQNGEKKRMKIHRTSVVEAQGAPGEMLEYSKKGIVVATGAQALQIHVLQLEGKKAMTAQEYACGFPRFSLL